jgi:hypothetical protein
MFIYAKIENTFIYENIQLFDYSIILILIYPIIRISKYLFIYYRLFIYFYLKKILNLSFTFKLLSKVLTSKKKIKNILISIIDYDSILHLL